MDSQSRPLSDEVVTEVSERSDAVDSFTSEEDRITSIAQRLWINSQIYKENRMNRISLFERLYNNELPRKERQLFNVCLPIFGGFEDALQANLTDPVALRFEPTNPADYLVTPKIQAQWEAEKDGLKPNQLWNSKARDMMHDALLSGRAIAKIYAENDPVYRSVLETTNYSNFHCQPLGGGNLENHLFSGEEGIYMTLEDIATNDNFPLSQRTKINKFAYTDEMWQNLETRYGTRFARFKSIGLDVYSNTFTGTKTLMLNQFVITRKGVRWYVLFDPISQIWLQCEKLEDFLGSSEYPWKSAATHQDSQNFWSKGFSDDIFGIALTVSTLLNQELTNREKQNFNSKAYDPSLFVDEQKLDAAQYQPDRLVPVDTQMGTRRIADGIFEFKTAELQGTINLIQWLESDLGKNVGITDLTLGAPSSKQQKAQVVLAQQQQVAKRIGFRSEPFKEMFGQVGESWLSGLKNFMPANLPVRILGEDGFTEESELKKIEVSRTGTIGVKVISTSAEQSENQAKKDARIQALGMVADSPNINSQWRDEKIMRDVGEFTDEEVKMAMDTQTYGSRKMVARASAAIQELLKGKMPDVYMGADLVFLQYIQDFMLDNQQKLMKKKAHPTYGVEVALAALFGEYISEVAPFVDENTKRKAKAVNAGRVPAAQQQGQDQGQTEPGGKPSPVASGAALVS